MNILLRCLLFIKAYLRLLNMTIFSTETFPEPDESPFHPSLVRLHPLNLFLSCNNGNGIESVGVVVAAITVVVIAKAAAAEQGVVGYSRVTLGGNSEETGLCEWVQKEDIVRQKKYSIWVLTGSWVVLRNFFQEMKKI